MSLMRTLIALLFLSAPAQAWTFSPVPICTVSDTAQPIDVTVTFDPSTGLYAIDLTIDAELGIIWPDGPLFQLQFATGDQSFTISTDRHVISPDGRTLVVIDQGFDNVLNGLQYNDSAAALIGGDAFMFLLQGAAEPVAQFRTCGDALTG